MKLIATPLLGILILACLACSGTSGEDHNLPEPQKTATIKKWLAPDYPAEASEQKLAGKTQLRVLVKGDGRVGTVEIAESSTHALLDSLAISSGYRCEFRPAVQRGIKIDSWLEMTCHFPPNWIEGKPCVADSLNPRVVFWMKPDYPESARRAREAGTVITKVQVLEDGTVGFAEVMKGPGFDRIEHAALQASYYCMFEPGVRNGKRVKAWMALPFNFRLSRGSVMRGRAGGVQM